MSQPAQWATAVLGFASLLVERYFEAVAHTADVAAAHASYLALLDAVGRCCR